MIGTTLALIALLGLINAQFPPTPEGVTVIKSKLHDNVTISFKEPGICEATPGVKSYSGYVHLPPGLLDGETQEFPINTFFWFFEAREDPENAPLAIWLNGGPGGSSMPGLLEENGPCFIGSDSQSTVLNHRSWNNGVNMLYIDQPTQVGFSYDTPTNATVVATERGFLKTPANFTHGVPETNLTNRVGTFGTQERYHTANTTLQAAHALWHFAQIWFFEFPHYRPTQGISLWTESYGGHYGPGFMRFFQEQNEKIANGTIDEKVAQYLHLDTLGIVNGLLDMMVQGESYVTFPYNNTYGIQVFNQSLYEKLLDDWQRPGGHRDQLAACRESLKKSENHLGMILRRHKSLADFCKFDPWGTAVDAFDAAASDARNWYDIGHSTYDPFPHPGLLGYLTQSSVLSALGVPVNYSGSFSAANRNFEDANDIVLGGFIEAVAYLLDSGVRVHMMYGDRDYACNWIGGEKASLAVNYSRAADFAKAGYAPLIVPDGTTAGMTRQLGNFSFTRVFQAGHEVPAYQPVASYEIFMRAMFGRDVATGTVAVTDAYRTEGPASTWHVKNEVPVSPEPRCYVLKPETCLPGLWKSVLNGTAVVRDWFVVDEDLEGGEEVPAEL
ncbi:serine carboxypeptidase [Echria macrotheca]|uniref:Serine carboxypeptidase n=1 Tax=Echria macrotheca TaxID=438768 RepID=A0AAJ0B8U9_9PEZI|nr:serine carboxypeptidase [Echria macrotheca]